MSANGQVVSFQPVDCGDMSEIPPDLPKGAWTATCAVKKLATAKDKYPMLALEWKTSEALTDGNEDFVGNRATDFVVFWPSAHKASRIAKQRFKTLCSALDLATPELPNGIKSWDDLGDFIAELDGLQATIYTSIETGKDGVQRTKVSYTAPGTTFSRIAAASGADDDEDEDKPAPKAAAKLGPNGRPLKKRA